MKTNWLSSRFLRLVSRPRIPTYPIKKILLVIIILAGAFLRFYRFDNFMAFYADSGRDIIISKHLIQYHNLLFIQPNTYGAEGWIQNTPVYYWLLATLWFLTRSPLGMGLFFSLFGVLTIFLVYKIGKELFDVNTGLLSALFIGTSNILINYSRSVWQPHLLPFFTALCLFLQLKAIKTRKYSYFIGLLASMFIALNIHLSFIQVFIIFTLISTTNIIKFEKSLIKVLILTFLFVTGLLLWIYMTGIGSSILPGNHLPLQSINFSLIPLTLGRIEQSITLLLNFPKNEYVIIITSIIFGGITTLFFIDRGHNLNTNVLAALTSSIIIMGLYKNPDGSANLEPHYYASYFIIYLIVIAYIMSRFRKYIVPYITILLLTLILLFGENNAFFLAPSWSSYFVLRSATQAIYADLNNNNYNIDEIRILNKHLGDSRYDWYTGPYWYFLEEWSTTQLIALKANGSNIAPLTKSKIYYIVCVNEAPNDINKDCLDPFYDDYSEIDITSKMKIFYLKNTDSVGFIYSIYRYNTI